MGTLAALPQPGHESAASPASSSAHDVLHYPAGTTLRFLLLVVMAALSSAFVGNWMFISTAEPGEVMPSWTWLALPPLAVILLAAALTHLAPAWLERRRGWVPVLPDDSPAALERFGALVAEAGLRHGPTLVWNPTESAARALSYGRPGAYRVAVSPALLGAARRRPAAFDAVVRHELAHISHRDVFPAYFAIIVWYVLVAALAVPLLWRIVEPDFSLVPDYLVRVGLLALVVYWLRADLLRTREHYADVRASLTDEHRQALLQTWEASTAVSTGRRFFSLHPSVDARAQVVREPGRLGRLAWGELFAVGVTAAWSVPLLAEVMFSTGWAVDAGARSTHIAVFALVGAFAGASLARWAGSGGDVPNLARAATGLAAGLAIGSTISLANTGLLVHAGGELTGSLVTAVVVTAYLFWAADLAQTLAPASADHRRARLRTGVSVAVSAVVVALVAGALLPAGQLIRLQAVDLLADKLFHVVAISGSAQALAVVAPLVGLAGLVAARRARPGSGGRTAPTVLVATALGVLAALLGLAVRLQTDITGDPDRQWRYFLAMVFIAVGCAAVAGAFTASGRGEARLLGAFLAAGITVVVAWAGFVAYENVFFGSTMPAADVLIVGRRVTAVVALVAAVPFALAWVAARLARRGPAGTRAGMVATGVVVATLAAGVVLLVPGTVMGEPPHASGSETGLQEYLADDVPAILAERDAAFAELQSALAAPRPVAVRRIRSAVVPTYDEMLSVVRSQEVTAGPATELHDALLSLLESERALLVAQADVLDARQPASAYVEAMSAADQAWVAWVSAYQEASSR